LKERPVKSLLIPVAAALLAALPAPAYAQSADQTSETPAATPADPKRAVLLWYDAFAQGRPELLDLLLAPTWVDIPSPPSAPPGPEAAKQTLAKLRTAFPDFDIKVDDVIREGDKVVVRSTITGTQKGLWLGLPATGRSMRIQAVDIHQFEGGQVARTWHTEDWMTGLRELGHQR
jgi:steroid delta-isomerase-like uncharacterized protein